MKKIIFLIMCVFFTGITTVHAQTNTYENAEKDFGIGIYGDINMDMFYSYGTSDNHINKAAVFQSGHHSFGSQNFLDDSYLGIDMTYKNLALKFELGISDYVRKYVLRYNFNDKYNQFISVGRDNTLAYYQMGQVLNGYQTIIPLNTTINSVLKGFIRQNSDETTDRVFKTKFIKRAFRTAVKRAEVEDCRFHDLRRTFATHLMEKNTPLYVIKTLLGHSSIAITEHYLHCSENKSIQYVEKLNLPV